MTLEDIVKGTDPELIEIFNITTSTKSAAIQEYIESKAIETGTDAKQITSEVRAEYVFHHYGLKEGKLDPYKLLSWPIDEEDKKGRILNLPEALQINNKKSPGIKGAIDIALQCPDRIDRSDEVLDDLIRDVVKDPGSGTYTRLDAAIYLLSHDKLDNEKHKGTREQIIEMFREKVFFHHYGLEDGKLDPCQLLSCPIDEESKERRDFKLPKALQSRPDAGEGKEGKKLELPEAQQIEGLWKQFPGIEGMIDIALQYPHRINTTNKVLDDLIDEVAQNPGRGEPTRLEAAIYFLDKLESYTENPREEILKQTLIHKFTEYDEIAKVAKIPLMRLYTEPKIVIPKPLRQGDHDVNITYQSKNQSETFNFPNEKVSKKGLLRTIDYLRSLNYQVDCYRPEGDNNKIYLNEKYINEYAGDDAINVFVHNLGPNYQLITKIKNEKTQEAIFEQWRTMYGPNFEFEMDRRSAGRIGQVEFHKKVCHENVECVFCDQIYVTEIEDLEAAHVDDYHACKGLHYAMDPSNGIPLCANHHLDFDEGYIKVWYDGQYHFEDPQGLVTATLEQVRQRLEHVEPKYINKKYRRLTC